MDFDRLLITLQSNMNIAMARELAKQLGSAVAVDAIQRMGIGWYPAENVWIFPERGGDGKVVGLTKRYFNGRKMTWKGSKRGYSYECVCVREKDEDVPARRFVRVSDANVPCPICGRERDGCMVSSEDVQDPAAVICVRTPDGATKDLHGAGFLHHRKPSDSYRRGTLSLLPLSDRSMVVTEGASDALAAMSAGYIAVGLPSANSATEALCGLVRGREVIIVGDRDAHGVGQKSLEAVFKTLEPVCKSVVKVLPPEPFKDLRAWGPTAEEFEEHVQRVGDSRKSGLVLDSDGPFDIVRDWLADAQMCEGHRLFQYVQGDFYRWDANHYRLIKQPVLHGWWYNWLAERQFAQQTKNGVNLVKPKPTAKTMRDLENAASAVCNIDIEPGAHEPLIIKTGQSMDLTRAVVFQNGIYYVKEDQLVPVTPDIFITTTLPYDYIPGIGCKLWRWFVADIFNGDDERIALLQEWIGYCLIASNHMQSMMFLFGVPGSGKSTVGRVMEALLGQGRCCATQTENFKDLFGKAVLLNKYLAVMSESRGTNKSDTDRLLQSWKAITGGDTISVRRLYKDAVDARLFCRLMYIANEVLPFDDPSQAMGSRTNLLYFPNNYRAGKPDRELDHKLIREAPGIAVWALEGLRRLIENDAFTLPESSRRHLETIAELTNPLEVMLSECCIRHVGDAYFNANVDAGVLYELWQGWCKANGVRSSMSSIAFGVKAKALPKPLEKTRIMDAGKRKTVFRGIEFHPGVLEKYLM